jgi:hypothetical protein
VVTNLWPKILSVVGKGEAPGDADREELQGFSLDMEKNSKLIGTGVVCKLILDLVPHGRRYRMRSHPEMP